MFVFFLDSFPTHGEKAEYRPARDDYNVPLCGHFLFSGQFWILHS